MPFAPLHLVMGDVVRRRAIVGTAAAAILVGAPLAAVAAPASAATPTSWIFTATQGLSLQNATALGSAAADTPLRVTVALNPSDKAALDRLVQAQNTPGNPAYHQYLTPAQFNARFAPSSATTAAV